MKIEAVADDNSLRVAVTGYHLENVNLGETNENPKPGIQLYLRVGDSMISFGQPIEGHQIQVVPAAPLSPIVPSAEKIKEYHATLADDAESIEEIPF